MTPTIVSRRAFTLERACNRTSHYWRIVCAESNPDNWTVVLQLARSVLPEDCPLTLKKFLSIHTAKRFQ